MRVRWVRLGLTMLCALLLAGPMQGSASDDIEALLQQAESVRSADPAAFADLLHRANAQGDRATPRQREQLTYLNAYAEGFAGRYDAAIEAARGLLDSADVEMRFRAGAFIINSYAVTLRFTEGLRQLEQTLALLPQIADPQLRQHGLVVAGVLYNQIGQYELGLHYADLILAEADAAPGRTLCFADQLRVEALQGLGRLPGDDALMEHAIERCAAEGELVVATSVRATLARKWAAQGKREQAITYLQKHLPDVRATRYPRVIGEVNSLLGELLFAHGDLIQAERHARAAVAQSAGMGYSLPLVAAYRTLYEVADRRGDPVAALNHYRNFAEADKAYLNDVNQREVAYQIVRQETELKTRQIELLDRQNQVLQLEQKVDRQGVQNTRLVAALLAVMLVSIGYWAYKIKRVQLSLKRSAETDALTGVLNRRHFSTLSEQSLAACEKSGDWAALVMFDLDHFKAINDSFGHIAGDWVLQRVTEICAPFCRPIDHFGRLGGEEFAILLHGADLRQATRLAEDCRVRISLIDTAPSGHDFRVTASFGVASVATAGYSLQRLLSQSDEALYRAKHDNRNCVRVHTGDAPATAAPLAPVASAGLPLR
ncbi:GGDEF domain-containing protein [Chiayiivirga flava]|uniref:diguanylate cyclase n=1 Tax=Chiayiivirga flava TaxID=659595 RepID=A0A7W8D6I9_9GAMM|nr:GGDEF domain-containing protein [Chiayiivirga flava]MBB5208452.1 diguanylate cyclase (GGDEF)-like protein [Chiayiivirga flava]